MRFFRFVKKPERIKVYLKDPDKKNLLLVIKELIVLAFAKREIPYYYFRHLYKKEVKNIHDYLGTGERHRIHADPVMNKNELTTIMQNKLSFAIYCNEFGLNSPTVVVHNFASRFFYNGKIRNNQCLEDLIDYFEEVFEKENLSELFVRPLSLLGGKGCFKLTSHNLKEKLLEQKEQLENGSYLFTKVVQQHPEINKIHGKSLNTIRFLTLITDDGSVELMSAAMRFGIGQSVVDNGSSGGFFIPIHLNLGTLKSTGWTGEKFGGKKITHHPNSNFELDGFKIPFYKEATEMVLEYTNYIPNKLVGWDIAITPTGPILIEANHDPYLSISDVSVGGILKNPNFKYFMDTINSGAKDG